MTAFLASPACGFVHTFTVKQSSLWWDMLFIAFRRSKATGVTVMLAKASGLPVSVPVTFVAKHEGPCSDVKTLKELQRQRDYY